MSQSQADCDSTPARHPNQFNPAVTKSKQVEFLARFATTGRWTASCKAAGIAPVTPYQWASKSAAFAKKLDEARELGSKALLAEYEGKLDHETLSQPFDKVTGTLTMFRMKRLDPAYRDNAQINVVATGPIAVNLGMRPETPRLENGESVEKSMNSDD